MEVRTGKLVLYTVIAMCTVMLFYFVAGAAVVTQGLEGGAAAKTQGMIIWLSVIVVLAFYIFSKRGLTKLGFRPVKEGAAGNLFYFIPVIFIVLLGLVGGIDTSRGSGFILANLFLTVGVGFSEEIYFRGIICNLWQRRSTKAAVLVSAVLFGVCHLMNVLGGASIVETILQIFFAFFYGLVFAFIFLESDSVWPCVALHFAHDFCSFIGRDISVKADIAVMTIQTLLLLLYIVLLVRKSSNG